MNFSIKKKIGLSFLGLVMLFVISSACTIRTLMEYKHSSKHIIEVTDPSLKLLYDFRKMLRQSEMFSVNWIFLRNRQGDKDSLIDIHTTIYPDIKKNLAVLSINWYGQSYSPYIFQM